MAARLSDEERAARAAAKEKAAQDRASAKAEKTTADTNRDADEQLTNADVSQQHARITHGTRFAVSKRNEPAAIKPADRRQNRYSGPSIAPASPQHRGIEEVLMAARKGAKKSDMDDATRMGIRSVLDHADSHLQNSAYHHRQGNPSLAHGSMLLAVGSLTNAIKHIDQAAGGTATSVHYTNVLQNHLNSYKDENLKD